MSSRVEQELQTRIAAFASDVTAILTRAVTESMGEALAVASSKKGSLSVWSQPRPAHGRGSSYPVDELYQEVKRAGGRRIEQIAQSLRTSTKSLALPMRKLIAQKKVTTQGKRRGTKYTAAGMSATPSAGKKGVKKRARVKAKAKGKAK